MHLLFAVTSKNARQKATYMEVSTCESTPAYFFFEFSDVDSLSGACSSQLAFITVIQAYYGSIGYAQESSSRNESERFDQ